MIKAPNRHRSKRLQKKINKRFGLLHFDRRSIYALTIQRCMEPLEGLITDDTIDGLGKQMIDIVKESHERS